MNVKKILAISLINTLILSILILSKGDINVYAKENNNGKLLEDKYKSIQLIHTNFDSDEIDDFHDNVILEYNVMLDEIEEEEGVYPDYYGGAYVDNSGELVVVVKAKRRAEFDKAEKRIRDVTKKKKIRTKNVALSYNELAEFKQSIIEFIEANIENEELEELLSTVSALAIDEMDNCIVIDIIDLTDEKIKLFKKNIDCRHVRFKNVSEHIKLEKTKLDAGRGFYNAYGDLGSIGFRAYRVSGSGNQYGFVTAGHVAGNVGQIVYADSAKKIELGRVSNFKHKEKVDASFVVITNSKNYEITNTISTTGSMKLNATQINLLQGNTVWRCGTVTGTKDGKVVSASADVYVVKHKLWFNDMVKTTCASDYGDSGGPTYAPLTSTQSILAGIHLGKGTDIGYYGKASTILKEFGLKLY